MAPSPCVRCTHNRAVIVRPKNRHKLCKKCFIDTFETEIHETIISNNLFHHGERIAIGASGGKDSTVLASVLKTLNERYNYGLELILLSIDEGIKGYRDDSLQTVRNNAKQYDLPLMVLGYDDLYGWTMDQVVEQVGKKGNCTYCGVFRRQALDRGAARLEVRHVVTGHNADDMAETVMMNLLRGDLPRLARATSIVTSTPSLSNCEDGFTNVKRSKPLKYAYEKEIVLYAHHKSLEYFCTECIYSPEAFRGSARALIKDLERIRPASILDIVKSGEDMAKQVPMANEAHSSCRTNGQISAADVEEDSVGGCGSSNGRTSGGELAAVEKELQQKEAAESLQIETDMNLLQKVNGVKAANFPSVSKTGQSKFRKTAAQKLGQCSRCRYISSQPICKACVLLESLNKNRPKMDIDVERDAQKSATITPQDRLEALKLQSG